MRNWIVLLVFSIYVISATEMYQFAKWPILMEHYNDHKSRDHKITFYDFLFMHYVLADDGDGDKSADMKLPFKSCDGWGSSVNATISFLQTTYIFELSNTGIVEKERHTLYKGSFLSSSFLSTIWQPPKSC